MSTIAAWTSGAVSLLDTRYRSIHGPHGRTCHRDRLSWMQSPKGLCYGNIIPYGSGARRTEIAVYPSARGVRLPRPSTPPDTRASRATVLFVARLTAYSPDGPPSGSARGGLGAPAVHAGPPPPLPPGAPWRAPATLPPPAPAPVCR